MSIIQNLKYSIKKRLRTYYIARTWAKHGDETRFHFNHPNISIGEFTYGIPDVTFYDLDAKLTIGKYCSIARDVKILLGGEHPIDYASSYPFGHNRGVFTNARQHDDLPAKDTTIGNDVWLGRGVTVLSGVSIGDGAVIGAGAVVSKDIPPYSVAVGNPIRIIRYRADAQQISDLLNIKWWNFPTETVNKLIPSMNNINNFITACYRSIEGGGILVYPSSSFLSIRRK